MDSTLENNYALIIAIEHYKDNKIGNVRFAENDAKELKKALLSIGYKDENMVLLIDDNATKTLIEASLKKILKSLTKDDELIIFYAGHGFTKNNHNYITCYDTVYSDLEDTSISLQKVFEKVRRSNSKKLAFLLDTCHSGLEIDESMRDIFSEMNEDEIEEFLKKSEYYVGFASCKNDEMSHSASALSHGIWTYHLLQVLTGEVPQVLTKGTIITAMNLQNYLSIEVPKTAKRYTSTGYQTPIMFGNISHEFIVADIKKILEERKRKKSVNSIQVDRVLFLYEKLGAIKTLSGFKKGFHRVPTEKNSHTEEFVNEISYSEIKNKTDEIFEGIKLYFNYKRKALQVEHGRIITPDFEVMINVEQDTNNPSEYNLRIELSEFTSIDVLESDELNELFSNHFDTIQLEFNTKIDIEELIDVIEELEMREVSVDYPYDYGYCQIKINGIASTILVTENTMRLTEDRKLPPNQLVKSLAAVRKVLLNYDELKKLE